MQEDSKATDGQRHVRVNGVSGRDAVVILADELTEARGFGRRNKVERVRANVFRQW